MAFKNAVSLQHDKISTAKSDRCRITLTVLDVCVYVQSSTFQITPTVDGQIDSPSYCYHYCPCNPLRGICYKPLVWLLKWPSSHCGSITLYYKSMRTELLWPSSRWRLSISMGLLSKRRSGDTCMQQCFEFNEQKLEKNNQRTRILLFPCS